MEIARKHNKPRLHLDPGIADPAGKLRTFLQGNSVRVLYVAGRLASKEPGVAEFLMRNLEKAFRYMAEVSKDQAAVNTEAVGSKKR